VLLAEKAAAPNNYMYENLAVSKAERRVRVCVSNFVVAAMLIAALVAVCGLKSWQKDIVVRSCQGIERSTVPTNATLGLLWHSMHVPRLCTPCPKYTSPGVILRIQCGNKTKMHERWIRTFICIGPCADAAQR
jgi:hypothetical protein